MGKPKMLGMFKPCVPNSRFDGKNRRAPWEGVKKKPKIRRQNHTGFVCLDEYTPWPPVSKKKDGA